MWPYTIDPAACYTDIAFDTIEAGASYDFIISFVDMWSNLHYQTLQDELDAGMAVTVTADYQNHDKWLSLIGIEDVTDWKTTYGTSILGTQANVGDGTMTSTFTIYRAGSYLVTVQIDGVDVVGSPYTLEVEPTAIDATHCVVKDVPAEMYAGF